MCAEQFGRQVSAPGAVDDRGDRTAGGVRSDALDTASARAIRKRRRTLFVSSGVVLRLKKIRCSGSSEAAQGAAQSHADFEAAIVHRPDGRAGPIGA
jgi:hypothetical protein